MNKYSLGEQWILWDMNRTQFYGRPTIAMISDEIRDRSVTSAYFVIYPPLNRDASQLGFVKPLEFSIELDRGKLTEEIKSDFTGKCTDYPTCKWAEEFSEFMLEHAKENDLGVVLDKALEIYEKYLYKPEDRDRALKTSARGEPETDVIKRLRTVYTADKKIFKIVIQDRDTWQMSIETQRLGKVQATLEFVSVGLVTYARFRLLSPRVKLGGNFSFGGVLEHEGFTPNSKQVLDVKTILNRILKILELETIDDVNTKDYSDDEFNSCLSRLTRSSSMNSAKTYDIILDNTTVFQPESSKDIVYKGKVIKRFAKRNNEKPKTLIVLSDTVGVSHTFFDKNIRPGEAYLYIRIITPLGVSCYCKAMPVEFMQDDKILITKSQLIDFGLFETDKVSVEIPVLSLPTSAIVIRRRYGAQNDEQADKDLLEYFEGANGPKVIANGHTYKNTSLVGAYFDVIDCGGNTAVTLQISGLLSKTLDIEIIIQSPPVDVPNEKKLSPLAIDFDAYSDSEEESDD